MGLKVKTRSHNWGRRETEFVKKGKVSAGIDKQDDKE